jgi:predicted LPLAT superfamily acyltransferase
MRAERTRIREGHGRGAVWDGQSKGSALGNRIFVRLIESFGPLPAYALLLLVAFRYALFDPATRRAIRSFRSHLGLPTRFYHLYRHVYSFGVNLIDGIAFLKGNSRPFKFTCIGEQVLVDYLSRGKGLILLSAHIGNWEVAANLLRANRDLTINLAMRDNERESIRRVLEQATQNRRVNVIPISDDSLDTMIRVRSALRRNEVVCFLGDRMSGGEASIEVPFLGEGARFPTGPFAVAAITGAPIVTVLTIKSSLRHFRHRAYGSTHFGSERGGTRGQCIEAAMKEFVSTLESVVREHPYQWFNFYDFWCQ